MLDSRSLLRFVALADELHFGRAAERLGIAQSLLSTQVRRIEDQLGTRLFVRGRRTAVRLTRAGETFLVEARLAIAQFERAERIGRRAGREEAGPLHIGYVFSAALSGALDHAVAAIRATSPDIELAAHPMETPEQIDAIAAGRLDMGFFRPRSRYPANVDTRIVGHEPLMLFMAAGHPLAGRAGIAPSALAGETFIVPETGSSGGLLEAVASLSRLGGFAMPAAQRTGDFVTATCLAVAGCGVVLGPRSLSRLALRGMEAREIDGYADTVGLALGWRRGSFAGAVAAVLGTAAEPAIDDRHTPGTRPHD